MANLDGQITGGGVLEGILGAGQIIANPYVITITDITGGHRLSVKKGSATQTMDVFDGLPGEKGDTGATGQPGEDGVSPTVSVTDITGGHRVTITDSEGSHAFDVTNGIRGEKGEQGNPGTPGQQGEQGEPGEDGYSPTVTVTEITGGHRVTITDATGSHVFDVMDGQGGGGGTSSFDDLTNRPKYNGTAMTHSTDIPEVKTATWDAKQEQIIAGTNITIASDGKTINSSGGGGNLEDHPTEDNAGIIEHGTMATIDSTLTQSGQAADAKVVGDKFSEQQSAIADKMGLNQGVRFDATQTLTDAQKAQAQQNIGVSGGGVDFLTVVDGKICIVYEKEDDEE